MVALPGTIRAGIHIFPPVVNECILYNCSNSGFNTDMFRIVMRIAGYNDIEFKSRSKYTGFVNQSTGGEWVEIVGSLVRGELDASASLLYIGDEREINVIDYSLPVTVAHRGFVVKGSYGKLDMNYISMDYILSPLRPYSLPVWMCMILMSLTIFLLRLFSSFMPFKVIVNRHLSLWKAFSVFFLFRAFRTEFMASVVDFSVWNPPFKNMHEFIKLLESGSLNIYQAKTRHFNFETSNINSTNYLRIKDILARRPAITFDDHRRLSQVFDDLIENPKLVIVTSHTSFLSTAQKKCDLMFVPIEEEAKMLAYGFQKHSKLVREFNVALYSGYSAVDFYDRIRQGYIKNDRRCDEDHPVVKPFKSVSFAVFLPSMILYSLSLILPTVYFLICECTVI